MTVSGKNIYLKFSAFHQAVKVNKRISSHLHQAPAEWTILTCARCVCDGLCAAVWRVHLEVVKLIFKTQTRYKLTKAKTCSLQSLWSVLFYFELQALGYEPPLRPLSVSGYLTYGNCFVLAISIISLLPPARVLSPREVSQIRGKVRCRVSQVSHDAPLGFNLERKKNTQMWQW